MVPVDPANVRKVILEETGGLAVNDPKLAICDYLFGNWEMNWIAYNYGHDITLPGSALGKKGEIPTLMYPPSRKYQAPPLVLNNLSGKPIDISNFKNKVVVVNFWASWCEPCREEFGELIELQEKYGSKGLVVLAQSC